MKTKEIIQKNGRGKWKKLSFGYCLSFLWAVHCFEEENRARESQCEMAAAEGVNGEAQLVN